jgi:hypothetical protein
MKKNVKSFIYILSLITILVIPYFVFAGPLEMLNSIQSGSGYAAANETTAATLAGQMVKMFFSILGIIFIILILYAGYNWMTAAGEEQKVTKAKDTIKRAIIGLLILVSSYAIWMIIANFIFANS